MSETQEVRKEFLSKLELHGGYIDLSTRDVLVPNNAIKIVWDEIELLPSFQFVDPKSSQLKLHRDYHFLLEILKSKNLSAVRTINFFTSKINDKTIYNMIVDGDDPQPILFELNQINQMGT